MYPYRNRTNTIRRYPERDIRQDQPSYQAEKSPTGAGGELYRRPYNISQSYGQAGLGAGSYQTDNSPVGEGGDIYRRPQNTSQPYGQAGVGASYGQPDYSLPAAVSGYKAPHGPPAYNSNFVSGYPKPHLPPSGPPHQNPGYGALRLAAVHPEKDYGNWTVAYATPPQYTPGGPQKPQMLPPTGGYAIPYNAPNTNRY